jgi:hypothetical protein
MLWKSINDAALTGFITLLSVSSGQIALASSASLIDRQKQEEIVRSSDDGIC